MAAWDGNLMPCFVHSAGAPSLEIPKGSDAVEPSLYTTLAVKVDALSGAAAHTLPDGRRMVVIVLDPDEAAGALRGYDPASGTSPSAADSRRIARRVLDLLRGE